MEKQLKHFPLQFFAENEDDVVEETIENSDEDDSEEETFDDGDETNDDVDASVEEIDEDNINNNEHRTDEKQKTKQTKKENEYFKKLRLGSKKNDQEQSNSATYEKGRINGILEAVNNVNPFTNEKIEDDEDVQEFLIMREMKQKGLDPVEDYSKYLKSLAREKRAEQKTKQKETEFVQNDLYNFSERYPNLKLEDVLKNDEFVQFANASIGKVPLADLYENYQRFTANINGKKAKEIETEVNKSKARSKASSGNLSTTTQPKKKDYSSMTDAQFSKMLEKAKRGELSNRY